jgi:hypothetical protein
MSNLKQGGWLGWDATAAGCVPYVIKSIYGPTEWPMEYPDLYRIWE